MKDRVEQSQNDTRPNAATALRWLMLVSAIWFFVIIALCLADDYLPFDAKRMIGYLVLVAAFGGSSWAFGWLQGRESDREKL